MSACLVHRIMSIIEFKDAYDDDIYDKYSLVGYNIDLMDNTNFSPESLDLIPGQGFICNSVVKLTPNSCSQLLPPGLAASLPLFLIPLPHDCWVFDQLQSDHACGMQSSI